MASEAGKGARLSAVRASSSSRAWSTASSSRVVLSGEDGSTEATSWRNAPISHPATSEWQSVDVAELSLPKADADKKEEVKEEVKVEPRGEAADPTEYEFVEVSDVESEALSDRPEPGEKEEQVAIATRQGRPLRAATDQSGSEHSGWHHWSEDHRSWNWQGGYHR